MFHIHRKEIDWGGRKLVLETGKVARQADGAVMVTYGETVVLCTAVFKKTVDATQDFFPLSVHYQEKYYATGRVPGGFHKRESRPSEKETLVSRLIDRPIRPLFLEAFKNETQVLCTVLSHDLENEPAIAAMIGSSAALMISGAPFLGPIGAARVGYKDGQYLLNPTAEQLLTSELDLVVAGTKDGVLMVESEAKGLSEEVMLGAVTFGHEAYQTIINMIVELAKEIGKDHITIEPPLYNAEKVHQEVKKLAEDKLKAAYSEHIKQVRRDQIDSVKTIVLKAFEGREDITENQVLGFFKDLEKDVVRGRILEEGIRIDKRSTTDIRPIVCETALLPKTHGSALFTRGETQALVVTTLGTADDEQIVDSIEGEYRERFLLHYNFPPYSVGEVGRMSSPGRREIGHGKLAWRAIAPMMPTKDQFPYTVRVVSEVTESNGSSSMATVCGASLALMDAGVPLPDHISGIAMGLIKEGDKYKILSDILGDEDHLGDMDFKVAGTRDGVTALQMDLKITSITADIMKQALAQAREGRLHIISQMEKAISGSREGISANAPQMETIQIPKDKIRDVIGTGGKVIREICEESGAKIDIQDDGKVTVSALSAESIQKALDRIRGITAEPELNGIYKGKVAKLADFGAFVNFLSTFGLVHISEIAPERVNKVSDVLNVGDEVMVKVIGYDDRGKIRLSIKAALAGDKADPSKGESQPSASED
jgi:polyribonucleotide nucleotidyltransferase